MFAFAVMFSFVPMTAFPSGQDIEKSFDVMAFHIKPRPAQCCETPPVDPVLHAAAHHMSMRRKTVTEAEVRQGMVDFLARNDKSTRGFHVRHKHFAEESAFKSVHDMQTKIE